MLVFRFVARNTVEERMVQVGRRMLVGSRPCGALA